MADIESQGMVLRGSGFLHRRAVMGSGGEYKLVIGVGFVGFYCDYIFDTVTKSCKGFVRR